MTTRYLAFAAISERTGITEEILQTFRLPAPYAVIGDTRGWAEQTIDAWNAGSAVAALAWIHSTRQRFGYGSHIYGHPTREETIQIEVVEVLEGAWELDDARAVYDVDKIVDEVIVFDTFSQEYVSVVTAREFWESADRHKF
ncbi:hypothetical protein ICL81_05780 [Leucobacter sp. cx-328]|uniref:hypothetical protein n=1 Tax=unclassified Leucobacter TaxID=2621730 RepID=UPI00165EAAB6|nr:MULTISPECIES: hypothetical protein [unclassified Leucobacter]MBC9944025.1 hypothetical protein [Leucobacter sp. cx-328]